MRQRKPDYILIGLVVAIAIFGLIMLSSASTAVSFARYGDSYYLFKRQFLFGFLIGMAAFYLFSKKDYRSWKKWAFPLLLVSAVLLIAVFIPGLGTGLKGAKRWIIIGDFNFQPAEVVKLTLLLYLAGWLESRGQRGLADFSYGFVPFMFILGAVMLLIILQPDMGTMSIIAFTALVVYFMAGGAWSHIGLLAGLGLFFFWLLIKIAPYRADRFSVFLRPQLDPQGIGYHINQAFLAIGSGGFWGRGFGQSRQKFQYLPEVAGDSIFAVISEELGFIFSAALVLAFLWLMFRGFKIASRAPDQFGRLLAAGITTWLVAQAFINIMAISGLLPLTGLPLPFISYGSSALITSLSAAGILVNISKQAK